MLEWIRRQWPLAWKTDLLDSKDDLQSAYQELDRLNGVLEMQQKTINEKNLTIEELRRQNDGLSAAIMDEEYDGDDDFDDDWDDDDDFDNDWDDEDEDEDY